jgi:cyclase
MVRKRLVTVLTFQDGVLFRTKMFQPDYRYTQNFVDASLVDEIVALDITRSSPGALAGRRDEFAAVIDRLARKCFVPLATGGGIRTIEDVAWHMKRGADKVIVNSGAIDDPSLIGRIAQQYGSQCVVVSIDAKSRPSGGWEVFAGCGQRPTGLDVTAWAKRAQEEGAGEVFLTSIDRDGSLEGYDLELSRSVADSLTIPVLICGGAGNWQHFVDGVLIGGASAVCTANIYHFTEASVQSAKKFMSSAGIPVRI